MIFFLPEKQSYRDYTFIKAGFSATSPLFFFVLRVDSQLQQINQFHSWFYKIRTTFYMLNIHDRIVFWTDSLCPIFNLRKNEILSKTIACCRAEHKLFYNYLAPDFFWKAQKGFVNFIDNCLQSDDLLLVWTFRGKSFISKGR